MLTRIYIDNFRSFVNFGSRPEQKQLLLGPNGSGKSSLLEAIRYVKWFIEGDENPFTQSTRTHSRLVAPAGPCGLCEGFSSPSINHLT